MDRHFIFKHYWWIAASFGGVAAYLAFCFGGNYKVGLIGAAIAGALGFCYFVQQQKLAETALFHQLFTAFNARYDSLNNKLAALLDERDLSQEQRGIIVDYFNLCAEEYLFYQQGYIPKSVWRSWCKGMAWYLKRHPYKDVWNDEIASESFYGLTLEKIHAGAV